MLTVVVVGALALLLNVSGIELTVGRDVDLNRELRAAGAGNVLAGLGGGMPGYHALSLTALAHRTGARSRIVGLVAAAVCALVLVFGGGILSLFPKPVLGGLLVFLGLSFLVEWLYDAWFRLRRNEYLLVVLILVVIAAVGFLQGVGLGVLVAVGLFVLDYARMDPVKHALTGETYQSKVDRHPEHRRVLRERGGRVRILELHGFLFFGTADTLLRTVRGAISTDLLYLVVDFRRVTGLDSSAVLGWNRVVQLAAAHGFTLVLTGLGATGRTQLERGGIADWVGPVRMFADLDRGVEWCEDGILADAVPEGSEEDGATAVGLLGGTDVDPDRLMEYLASVEVPEGHVLIREGDASDDLYILASGRLMVTIARDGGDARLRTVGPGAVVGEVTMYLGTRRSASVRAVEPCHLYRLTRASLAEMEARDPVLAAGVHRAFARLLADRLTDSLGTIDALLD